MHGIKFFPRYRYVLVALLALVIAIAAMFSIARETTLLVSLRSLFFLLAACSLSVLFPCTLETLTWLFFCLGLAGTFISIITLAGAACSILGLDLLAFAVDQPDYMYGLPQVEFCFENPNTFGLFLVFSITGLIIFFALIRDRVERKGPAAFLFYLVLAIQLLALTLTFSRAAFVALALFVSSFIWLNNGRHSYAPLVLLGAVFLFSRHAFESGSMSEMLEALFSGRIQLWAEGIRLFAQYPLLGTGLGGWFAVTGNRLSLHNTYLHLAVELGLAGLTLYITCIALFLRDLRIVMQKAVIFKYRYTVLSGLYSLCLGLLVHQWFESYLYYGLPLFLFAIIPLHTLLREPGKLYHFRELVWKQHGILRLYRKAG
jgi:O-antigen ligase